MLLALLHGLVSCRQQNHSEVAAEPHEEPVHFAKGKGLALSEETRSHMRIHLSQVEQREVAASIRTTAQVFRDAVESTSLAGVYRKGYAYASANVPAESAKTCHPNALATVTRTDDPSVKIEGRILLVDQALQGATKTIELVLELPDTANRFPVGTFVAVSFQGSTPQSMLAVPRSALFKAAEGDFVYVKNGKYLLRVPVEVGAMEADWAGITKGLYPGDQVVTSGVETLWLTELGKTQAGSHAD